MSLQHGRGHLPDPPEVVARRKGFHLLQAKRGLSAEALPLSISLKPWLMTNGGPGIFDQGQTGSCEGHAHAGAITLRFAKLGIPIPIVSPICCYTLARCVGRQRVNGKLPPLADEGTEPSLVIAAIQEWGVTSIPTWGHFPADPATINDEPTLTDLEKASDFKLLGAYFLQSSGDEFVIDLMTALNAGYPVSMALPASGPVFNGYKGGILGALSGDVDHANYIIGATIPKAGAYDQVVVECVNSWSEGWGETGTYRGSRAFVDQLQDACVVDVAARSGSVER